MLLGLKSKPKELKEIWVKMFASMMSNKLIVQCIKQAKVEDLKDSFSGWVMEGMATTVGQMKILTP